MHRFTDWHLSESTMRELHATTIRGFPRTLKRQFSIDPIRVQQLVWMPYVGVKTLVVRSLVYSGESKKEYSTIIMFKDVVYHKKPTRTSVTIAANDKKKYYIDRIDPRENDVYVRCQCQDFHWRFNWYNADDKSLYGKRRAPYEPTGTRPPVNPDEVPGFCKHLLKLIKVLEQSGAIII